MRPEWFPRDPAVGIPRRRQPGEEVLRLRARRLESRRRLGRDDLQDDELLFSRRCADNAAARYVAESFRTDTLKAGWVDVVAWPRGRQRRVISSGI